MSKLHSAVLLLVPVRVEGLGDDTSFDPIISKLGFYKPA